MQILQQQKYCQILTFLLRVEDLGQLKRINDKKLKNPLRPVIYFILKERRETEREAVKHFLLRRKKGN